MEQTLRVVGLFIVRVAESLRLRYTTCQMIC